ncbi:RING finger protein 224-like [Frankliniella occidentalis]|uniref:RING finger protein 224-like n=1 Tax=Frankliniella occidentalis TaxID=133901 RepID=A0A9C6WY53_FRAOC|nr:RING finger protein 224-like [Frankliniella occidentalis]
MECNICFEAYDLEVRVPKTVVPCGHPVCLPCLQRVGRQQCPSCREPFTVRPASLPNNFSVIDLMENQGKAR